MLPDNRRDEAFTEVQPGDVLMHFDNAGKPGVPQTLLTFGYDTAGYRFTLDDSRGGSIGYFRDLANRLTQILFSDTVNGLSAVVELGYDRASRLISVSRTDDRNLLLSPVTTALAYNTSDLVTNITHKYGATQLSAFAYTYNPEGELISYTGPEGTLNYTHDDTHQLTGATGARTETYSYDANGNRTMAGYSTGVNNRVLSDGTFNYEYDDEGNWTRRTRIATGEVTEYTWDYRNRLTKAVVKNSAGAVILELRFTYDVNNNLIIRWTDPDGAGPTAADQVFTLYDGVHAFADFNSAGQLLVRRLYGENTDQLIARVFANGNVDWYLTDLTGSVRQIADVDGTILNANTFDSFGNLISQTNPTAGDRFKFTARELESLIGLSWYRARWYDPAVGRFISEDPIGFGGRDANLSRYVHNNPNAHTDPLGLYETNLEVIWTIRTSWLSEVYNPSGIFNQPGNDWYNQTWDSAVFYQQQSDALGAYADFFAPRTAWEIYRSGCRGLQMLRTGGPIAQGNPEAECFTSVDQANAYLEEQRANGNDPLLTAVQVPALYNDPPAKPLAGGRPTQVDPRTIPVHGNNNYASYLGYGMWEYIDHGGPGGTVTHGVLTNNGFYSQEYFCVTPRGGTITDSYVDITRIDKGGL